MRKPFCNDYPENQNQIVFRTPVGSRRIPAGETVRLNDTLPDGGIPVANFETIRIYAVTRPSGTVPVTFSIFVLDTKNDELIFRLDTFTLTPQDPPFTRTYVVPGPALVVFAEGGSGTGGTGIDFGVIGFGPLPCYPGSPSDEGYGDYGNCYER